MPKKTAAANRKKFLADQQAALFEMKNKLIGEIEAEIKAEREGNKDEGMDTYDLASEERDREINFILSDRERVKSQSIDDALGADCRRQLWGLRGLRPRNSGRTPARAAVHTAVPRLSAGSGARGALAAAFR